MPLTIVVEEPEQDPNPSSGPARSNLEDGPDSHYISPLFHKEFKKVIDFKLKYFFRRNYRVLIPSEIKTVDNPPPGCIGVYLEALQYGLWFFLPKIVMKIL